MKHLSFMDFRASASFLAPEGHLKRGECFISHVSAAGDERTPTVITLQHRLNHEGYPRGFMRCMRNRYLRACSPFPCEQLSASTKTYVTKRSNCLQISTHISSTIPLFGTPSGVPFFLGTARGVIA